MVERCRLGRLLRALSDSPTALTSLGTSLNVTRVIVFCLSAFLAGLSGALYASLFGSVNQDSFNYLQSLVVLAVLAISGRRSITSAVVGSLLLYVLPGYISDDDLNVSLQIGFGVAAIVAAVLSQGQLGSALGRLRAAGSERTPGPLGTRLELLGGGGPRLALHGSSIPSRFQVRQHTQEIS